MKRIKLTKGFECIVDDDDYEDLMKYKWQITRDNGIVKPYAMRGQWKDGKTHTIRMHRQIMNAPQGVSIDHINGDTLDNRKSNLRFCTQAENSRNRGIDRVKNKISKFKGVTKFKNRIKCWVAQIEVDGKRKPITYHYTEKEAAIAYDEMAKKYFGEFAWLNQENLPNHFSKK